MVECYSSFSWLPEVLNDFNIKHPHTEVIVESSLSHDYEHDLVNEIYDVGLVVNKKSNPDLEFFELINDRLVVVMSEESPLAKYPIVGFESLRNETLITHCKNGEMNAIFEHITPPKTFRPKKVMRVTSTESIINLVDRGIGVAVMSEWAVNNYCKGRKLLLKPFEKGNSTRPWYLVTKKNAKQTNQSIDCFIDLMKAQIN